MDILILLVYVVWVSSDDLIYQSLLLLIDSASRICINHTVKDIYNDNDLNPNPALGNR